MMGGIWLLCDYKGKQFDVRIDDVDETSFIDMLHDIHMTLGSNMCGYLRILEFTRRIPRHKN